LFCGDIVVVGEAWGCGFVAGDSYGVKGGVEQFELLLVIIDGLEEPLDLVLLLNTLIQMYQYTYSVIRILAL
jgi:hypothetical protein